MQFIPRTMSTQHPDNVHAPFFSENPLIDGEDEIVEAYSAFSVLGCHEQLFDYEGKETDNFIIKKLLLKYPDYFRKHILGRDRILSFRVPNPNIEKTEAKHLIEVLNTIPRYHDTAMMFYKGGGNVSREKKASREENAKREEKISKDCSKDDFEISPVSEVYVPMVSSSMDVSRVAEYYKSHVAGVQHLRLFDGDIPIRSWLGTFKPDTIRVNPLLEDMESLLNVDKIVGEYIRHQKIKDYQRVWLARSDPALNYSSLSAILLNKLALVKLQSLQESSSVEIFPLFGCGSSPFRGNFRPDTVGQIMKGYPSVQTFTLQSSFKYDHPLDKTKASIEEINAGKRKAPMYVEEARLMPILEKVSIEYKKQMRLLAELVNNLSAFVPKRRKRKLHIGLFGYSRANEGVHLPRAISFCCAMYSLGLPPELLGLNALSPKDIDYLKSSCYANFSYDIACTLKYFNKGCLNMLPLKTQQCLNSSLDVVKNSICTGKCSTDQCDRSFDTDLVDNPHVQITSKILDELRKPVPNPAVLTKEITAAASIRGFLG